MADNMSQFSGSTGSGNFFANEDDDDDDAYTEASAVTMDTGCTGSTCSRPKEKVKSKIKVQKRKKRKTRKRAVKQTAKRKIDEARENDRDEIGSAGTDEHRWIDDDLGVNRRDEAPGLDTENVVVEKEEDEKPLVQIEFDDHYRLECLRALKSYEEGEVEFMDNTFGEVASSGGHNCVGCQFLPNAETKIERLSEMHELFQYLHGNQDDVETYKALEEHYEERFRQYHIKTYKKEYPKFPWHKIKEHFEKHVRSNAIMLKRMFDQNEAMIQALQEQTNQTAQYYKKRPAVALRSMVQASTAITKLHQDQKNTLVLMGRSNTLGYNLQHMEPQVYAESLIGLKRRVKRVRDK